MFEITRFTIAKNRVSIELAHEGLIGKEAGSMMSMIAGNRMNMEYAKALLKSGTAKCKYSAAAAVFARIAEAYERNPTNGLTAREWKLACQRAMVRAGANESEVETIVDELIAMNRKVASEPIFRRP